MPFTPFHMGPGLAIKAVGGRHVSLLVFGFSQVAIDVEPLVRIIRGDAVLHGFTHTYLGATLVALLAAAIGRPVGRFLMSQWTPDPSSPLHWLRDLEQVSWPASIAGAFVGTYSHVLLDSVMHADLRPLAPFAETSALLGIVSVGTLHLLCVFGGVLGALLLFASAGRHPRGRLSS
jgi:hypothetical protein